MIYTDEVFTRSKILSRGTIAPYFNLYATPDEKLSLSDLKGKRVLLAFYPADWSPVCGDQMTLYNEALTLFGKYNTHLIGISVDGRWCHSAYSEHRNLAFPLLSDFEPKGAVSKLYGVYQDQTGESERGLFLIDEQGIIQWSYLSPIDENPGADRILNALDELQT